MVRQRPHRDAGLFQTSDDNRWRNWVADVVGDMLEKTPEIICFLQKEKFADFMETCLDEASGNVSALSRKLGVSRRTVRDWCSGVQLPQLASMLRLCSILEIFPLQIFSQDCRSIGASKGNGFGVAAKLGEKTKKFYRVLDVEKVRGELVAELQQEGVPPRPMSEVAMCLGYDHSFLYKHLSELCRAISDRYRAYRKKQREERKQRILDEVRQTTFRVYKQGLYPSQERVRLLLAKPGSIKEPGALAVWHEVLAELGLESKVP
jgi:transcriptional regulator with XRE-family HTH domain